MKYRPWFAFGFVLLLAVFTVEVSFAAVYTVTMSPDSSGSYVCDGLDDHVEINLALSAAEASAGMDTVYLKGPADYLIDGTVLLGGNLSLTGDSTAAIKLRNNANWSKGIPLLKNKTSNVRNIYVHGFELDGNDANNQDVDSTLSTPKARYTGSTWYDFMIFSYVTNLHVYDMYIHHNLNDGLQLSYCDSVYYHDNQIIQTGHDGLYAKKSTHVWAYNNLIRCRTNSGLRLWQTNHSKLYNNTIYSVGEGGSGFEIQKDGRDYVMNDIEICGNTIYETRMAAFWVFGSATSASAYSPSDAYVHIHHNKVYNASTGTSNGGGTTNCGFNLLLENNVFDGCYAFTICVYDQYTSGDPYGTGYETRLRNNIITNTRSTGRAIYNSRGASEKIILENNCLYGNATNYLASDSVTATDNIFADPLFANRTGHDYHLKSLGGRRNGNAWVNDAEESPCIDAGYAGSDYSNEPAPNGGRINIGLYGNTEEASKTAVPGVQETSPGVFSLSQNVPNPFNPETAITCFLPEPCVVRMNVYNTAGQEVDTIVNGRLTAGAHTVHWRPKNLGSGVFFCRMEAEEFAETIRLVYVK